MRFKLNFYWVVGILMVITVIGTGITMLILHHRMQPPSNLPPAPSLLYKSNTNLKNYNWLCTLKNSSSSPSDCYGKCLQNANVSSNELAAIRTVDSSNNSYCTCGQLSTDQGKETGCCPDNTATTVALSSTNLSKDCGFNSVTSIPPSSVPPPTFDCNPSPKFIPNCPTYSFPQY